MELLSLVRRIYPNLTDGSNILQALYRLKREARVELLVHLLLVESFINDIENNE